MTNIRSIIKVIGTLFSILGTTMLACSLFALDDEGTTFNGFINAGFGSIVVGLAMYFSGYNYPTRITKREGYLIVGLSWVGMALVCSLPYAAALEISVIDALFESVSGLTTTGATIFEDIESLPNAILFWRSLTQWIGGMGIIVLTVALLPLLGVGGVELFTAEAPGPTSDKIHPRIRETAKRLWLIYFSLTIALFVLLFLQDMTWFDAINHALTTMATGGFSTKNASIAHFNDPGIEYTITFFMLLAGINYTVLYFMFNGKFRKVLHNEEWRTYLIFVMGFTALISLVLYFGQDYGLEEAFRKGAFR